MATAADMSKEIEEISNVWGNPAARNGLFGNLLKSVHVQGVRGMTANLEFTWPVTAIRAGDRSYRPSELQVCGHAADTLHMN